MRCVFCTDAQLVVEACFAWVCIVFEETSLRYMLGAVFLDQALSG